MNSKKKEKPIKASELIKTIEEGDFEADVVDEGDLYPYLSSASIEVDSDNYCSVKGYYSYHEDTATRGVDPGRSEADVLGVIFGRDVLSPDEIDISGREIVYDGDLTEDDVLDAAEEYINFPDYDDGSDYEFDEGSVTSDELYDVISDNFENNYIFALDEENSLRAYDSEEDVPEGFEIIDNDEAFRILSSDPLSISYDLW